MAIRPLLLLALVAAALGQDDQESLDAETLALDLAAARRIAKVLPPRDMTVKDLLAKLDAEVDEENELEGRRDLGCGGTWTRAGVMGGYESFWITLVSYGDRVGALEIVYDLHGIDALEAKLRPILGDAFKRERASEYEDRLRYRFVNETVQARFAEALAAKLGKPEEKKVPDDLRAAYATLTDPLALLDFGWISGEGARPAAGREEIEKLLKAGDVALLRNVARGPNPEGRIYAAEALLRLERKGRKLTDEETKLVEAIRALPVRITCVGGCDIGRKAGAEALAEGLKDSEYRDEGK